MISSQYNHPVMTHDDSWRDLPQDLQVLTSMRGLPDIRPVATNGVLIFGYHNDGREYLAHLENMIKPEKFSVRTSRKPSKPLAPKAKKRTELFDMLLAELF